MMSKGFVSAAAKGLRRVLHHRSPCTRVFSCQPNPQFLFNFTPPYSTHAPPSQIVDKTTSKDADVKDVPWNLWVPNQFSGGIYEALDNYGIDLTELASRGIIDPVIDRADEIELCINILSQKTKNNPVIVGKAGVGKTAIAEGLAQRIFRGDVPECLRNRQLYSVDIGSLLVGAMYAGQFEERIKHVIREVTASNGQIILFIDEIQTVVGAVKEVIRSRRQRSCIICLDLVNFNHIMRPKSYDICSTLLCLRSNFLWQILAILGPNQQDCSE